MSAPVAKHPLADAPVPSRDPEAPHRHEAAAEEVRAWLVTARAGAPFLSAGDGRALLEWLDEGVGVADLLRAIDETAAHRRAKRLRQPFTLRSIAPRLRARTQTARVSKALPARDEAVPWPDGDLLAEELSTLLAESGGTDDAVVAASARVRAFFDDTWAALAPHHAELQAAAAEDLGDVSDLVDEHTRAALCEEYARERMRARYPTLRLGSLLG